MSVVSFAVLFFFTMLSSSSSIDLFPWETYLQLGSVEKPLGLIVNESSLAHRHFLVGYLCLHSFMYDTAQEAFQLAIESDPTLVEAHIGRLLGHKQALWSYTNRSGALEVLNDTRSLFAEYNVSLTPIQSSYMKTVSQWFLPENTFDGEEAFLNSMLNLTQEFSSNYDARTLLGLAYLNKAQRESVQSNTLESSALLSARKILHSTLIQEPAHPGCLHYLIHAFDVPIVDMALQGVPYAYKYSQAVLTGSHAQHMPTHIWTRIGTWSLAQAADSKAIEVSLSMCLRKQLLSNDTLLSMIELTPLSLSQLIVNFNLTQSQDIVYCDRDNRVHSQEWLVYSYLQTGQYNKSFNVLKDLVCSHQIYPLNNYYIPFVYGAQAYLVIETFFWTMYGNDSHRTLFIRTIDEVLAQMNSTTIEIFNDTGSDSVYILWREVLARFIECIHLLLTNGDGTSNSTSLDYHLARMSNISTIMRSQINSTAMRILTLVSEINALRWCLNGSMLNCLIELDKTTQIESSIGDDYQRPYVLHIYAAELFAFYLLITHRYYFSLASTYTFNNSAIAITDFPSYALRLYARENQTAPHRAVNSLGMARAYSQMGQIDQASEIYRKILRDWSDSTFPSEIDRWVITEASNYLREVEANQTRSDGFTPDSSSSLINILLMLIFFIH